ncbi:hypothetical protein [Dysosmobacter welbionis]
MENMSYIGENGELARTILDKFMRGFQERNSNLHVFSAHIHMDEATPICRSPSFPLPPEVNEACPPVRL